MFPAYVVDGDTSRKRVAIFENSRHEKINQRNLDENGRHPLRPPQTRAAWAELPARDILPEDVRTKIGAQVERVVIG
jgi:hypothetical protein